MYLQLNSKQCRQPKSSKKKTVFWVSIIHILAVLLIFLIFCFKGCSTRKNINTIRVNVVSSVPQSAEPVSSHRKKQAETIKKPQKKVVSKKNWKALDPSQIKKSTSTVTKKVPKKRNTPIKASDIAGSIRQQVKKIKFSNSYNADKSVLSYFDKVSQYLYSEWKQPSRSITNNGIPVVRVRVSIDRNGTILNSSIASKSGIVSMDSSVENLLSTLSSLPSPPEGAMEFDIYLELTNN
jgi:TonB family protein